MAFFRSLLTAFSMYSRIPVPRLSWKEENLRYAIGLFPLVGVVIGLLSYGFIWISSGVLYGFPRAALYALISLLISGGIHLDGYLDTSDALSSFGERDKKLKILSDPHIGSFAVIRLLCYYLVLLAAYTMIEGNENWLRVSMGFYLSRILSGSASTLCRSATREGTLFTFTDGAQKLWVRGILIFQLILCAGLFLFTGIYAGGLILLANFGLIIYWRIVIYGSFGGITGDTAGFLSTLSECVTAVAVAVWELYGSRMAL